ncbi:MAG: metal ABC transporter ATP-binding protein [Candidatus Portnoybacteria bacterium]|nr:metal ABC transporter ATP-binding protein [Candidatus Portnoybacteria bacterium]
MMKDTILEVKNLGVTLDSQEILRDISFSVKEGEALAVIGPNGAGKTVLFRALLGLLPYKGEIRWKENIQIGYVPQKLPLDRSIPITLEEFFLLKSQEFWFPQKSFSDHIKHELELLGLTEGMKGKMLAELSTGQLQRAMIAWAMLNHPHVLLFDEPTAGIDVGFEETVYTIMRRLQKERGTTILLISHDLNIVYRYADQVLCLNKELVCQGRPAEVLNKKELSLLYGEVGFYHHLPK